MVVVIVSPINVCIRALKPTPKNMVAAPTPVRAIASCYERNKVRSQVKALRQSAGQSCTRSRFCVLATVIVDRIGSPFDQCHPHTDRRSPSVGKGNQLKLSFLTGLSDGCIRARAPNSRHFGRSLELSCWRNPRTRRRTEFPLGS